MVSILKGSLLTSLSILFLFSFSFISIAQDLDHIANDDRWHALLHLKDNQPVFTDNFILSKNDFSPLNELAQTLQLFRSESTEDKSQSCRFIARHFYLSQYFNLKLPKIDCPDFTFFQKSAPIDEIDLLFASENFTQPSSIMGHTMLAITNYDKSIQHSVSFFTDIDNPNPIGLLWESLYTGKPGYFLVQPLQPSIRNYLEEQRNIWRYTLALSHQEKALIQRHLWELKFLSMPYLFNSHNCATLSFDILRVAQPGLIQYRQNWLSPIDVIKSVHALNLIKQKSIHASAKWKVRTLNQSLNLNQQDIASLDLTNTEPATLILAKNFYDYRYQNGEITLTDWQSKDKALLKTTLQQPLTLSISNPKDPLFTPNDSQFGIARYHSNELSWVSLSWMPASHQLTDDNSQYVSENELKILQTRIRLNSQQIQLESLNIYSVKSLLPTNNLTNDLSGEFSFGLDRFNFDNESESLSAYLLGGIGKTFQLHPDFKVYGLWSAGMTQSKNYFTASTGPQLGIIFNQVFNSKSVFYAQQNWRSNHGDYWEVNFDQSINYWKRFNFVFNINQQSLVNYNIRKLSLAVNIYY